MRKAQVLPPCYLTAGSCDHEGGDKMKKISTYTPKRNVMQDMAKCSLTNFYSYINRDLPKLRKSNLTGFFTIYVPNNLTFNV